MRYFDTHAHIGLITEDPIDQLIVVQEARQEGVQHLVTVSNNLIDFAQLFENLKTQSHVYHSIGISPSSVVQPGDDWEAKIQDGTHLDRVVAIGEIGLDYHHLPGSQGGTAADDLHYKQKQADLFRQQLEVAVASGLNCVIHQRDAFDDTLAQMKSFAGEIRGVFHCFGENADRMRQVLAIGSLVSFTGIVTFKNGQNVRDTVAATPLDKFMVETDCPYLAPAPYRGKRCEPAYVKEISELVARVKNCSLDELSAATCRTATEFFPKL